MQLHLGERTSSHVEVQLDPEGDESDSNLSIFRCPGATVQVGGLINF